MDVSVMKEIVTMITIVIIITSFWFITFGFTTIQSIDLYIHTYFISVCACTCASVAWEDERSVSDSFGMVI